MQARPSPSLLNLKLQQTLRQRKLRLELQQVAMLERDALRRLLTRLVRLTQLLQQAAYTTMAYAPIRTTAYTTMAMGKVLD